MKNENLIDALCARSGIVCAVGAGGKKSTLYRLLEAHPGRVGYTTTVFTLAFPEGLPARFVVAPSDKVVDAAIEAAGGHDKIALACPSDKPGRYAGLTSAQINRCHAEAKLDLTLVKADGARMRWFKAPADNEPVLVDGTTTILGLVSAHVVGMTLSSQHVHRPERVAAVTGAAADEALTPTHVARLIASEDGLLRRAGAARVVPVINMADSPQYLRTAREVARIALDCSDRYDRVVITAMYADEPLVEMVTRPGS